MDIQSELDKMRKELVLQQALSFPKRAAARMRSEGLSWEDAQAEVREQDANWIEQMVWKRRLQLEGARVQPVQHRKARAPKFGF